MLKVKVNLPEDMTDVYNKIADFQAEMIMKKCTPTQVEAIIKYLESKEQ
ncbi:hypothetical protein UT300005_05260 [Clostridium sp. CTA-5]